MSVSQLCDDGIEPDSVWFYKESVNSSSSTVILVVLKKKKKFSQSLDEEGVYSQLDNLPVTVCDSVGFTLFPWDLGDFNHRQTGRGP